MNKFILLFVALTTPLIATEKLGFDAKVVSQVKTICKTGGCWADLMAIDGTGPRIEVKDGIIVIPVSALNRTIDTTVPFIALKLTREQTASCLEHLERDSGKVDNN